MKTETKKMYRPVLWRIVIALSTTTDRLCQYRKKYGTQLGTELGKDDEGTISPDSRNASISRTFTESAIRLELTEHGLAIAPKRSSNEKLHFTNRFPTFKKHKRLRPSRSSAIRS
jgi:hypothetical protein